MKLLKLAGVLVGASVLMSSVHAEEFTGRLKKIKDSGTLTLGVRDSSIPFSYLDDKQSYQGYSIDLCLKAATAIQKKLGLTSLNIKMVPVTSATRIPLIANGTTDISCDSATNNQERWNQVAFSVTEFVTANKFLSKKSANLKTLDDLKGKTVVSTSGTSNLKQITALNAERNLGMNILAAKDHAEAFLMVETGRAAAFVMDDILLSSLAANSKAPADYQVSSEALSVEPYGLILPKGDNDFKKVVDEALTVVYKGDDIKKIYAKWFQSPIPPKGVNLNVPMSPQLQAVLAKPTDSYDPAAYAAVPEAQKNMGKKK
ncbi:MULTISPECIES: amino acid ABC transporter substrate-binding protein [Herbaspirillum]|uniref:amino acid ABC transporter substrate-binding protein n=2 Tax=Oxalobacteraceae TaxID=75682 RepID=UPI000C0AFDBC|nr:MULTISPECIES: amino acid ABC transporter substrate-binding protein [Herbaspirillum]MAF02505.1 amino acid ABC transporter substrate-binding protein [Herbaspirillum sp.]MBN9357061.1 amino acid ABC transporter substrate-binding protein [Herbaspirillum huttiense]MBO14549.1 amino acid ABC transporter substrate-binding protein [Herbaspirillum sp.]MCP3657837.1 amino acid ABC transporter substrate-binding protein [Herbaspirillum sp.]MCP3950009.1 amino acid ABC transporter substrate-binding protein 